MSGGSSSPNPPKQRKRVEADTPTTMLKRAKDGSAFTKCEVCKKDVAVVLIDMHDCGMDSNIKMNLSTEVVEKATEFKKPERKRAASTGQKEKKTKKEKKNSDPNKPKRPPTAFFLFMDDFRKEYKEANPDNKSVANVAKEGGAKWKVMTDEEKKPYIDRAAELKAEHGKAEMDDVNEEGKGEVEDQEENGEDAGKELSDNEEE